jgi:PAS domain S-box-containing protein
MLKTESAIGKKSNKVIKKGVIKNAVLKIQSTELFNANYARSLIEASLDPLVTISVEGKILDVNEASIKVTGVSREKLIGTDFSNYFTEPKKAQKGYQQVFEKGFVADYPLTIKHQNQKLTDVLYNASVYRDGKGNVLGVFAAARDVTEQKWAKDLRIANKELAFQNEEKEKRAQELSLANKKLAFENEEKEKRAAELIIANKELAFQNKEKEKRAKELSLANKKLAFENEEKEKRAAELIIANKELAFQNKEKEKRAKELSLANKKLAFENEEKEKRAAELIIANKELAFQNEEKEKRAAELAVANKELAFQNDEKEKRAAELVVANKELLAFTYISSHDLQEPLRKIQTFVTIILENESENLTENGKYNFERMQLAAGRMQQLIDDLLAFSRINTTELIFENVALSSIVDEVKNELRDTIQEKMAIIEYNELGSVNIIAFQFRQLVYNLISNALKFSSPNRKPLIIIKSAFVKGSKTNIESLSLKKKYCHITFKDNGIGFEPHFSERIFEVFQKLHGKETYAGTGIGLAIVKKIVENHGGIIVATSELNKTAQFDIYIPA